MDTTTTTPPLAPRIEHIRRLAEIIREVHGSTITVDALALAILAHPGFSGCHDGPAALPDADQAEGPSLADVSELCKEFGFHYADGETWPMHMCTGTIEVLQEMITAAITRWPAPAAEPVATPPPLPPEYIDPEHQGEDRKLLEAFQRAWWADGGRCVDRDMRGIWAVMALRPTVAAVRAADAAIADETLEAEFRAWWRAKVHPLTTPAYHTITTHVAWGRHLLSRGEL